MLAGTIFSRAASSSCAFEKSSVFGSRSCMTILISAKALVTPGLAVAVENNPNLAYCRLVISPKLKKFEKVFSLKLVK